MGKYNSRSKNIKNEQKILEEKLYNYNKELARVQSIEKTKKNINYENLELFYKRKIHEFKKHLRYES